MADLEALSRCNKEEQLHRQRTIQKSRATVGATSFLKNRIADLTAIARKLENEIIIAVTRVRVEDLDTHCQGSHRRALLWALSRELAFCEIRGLEDAKESFEKLNKTRNIIRTMTAVVQLYEKDILDQLSKTKKVLQAMKVVVESYEKEPTLIDIDW